MRSLQQDLFYSVNYRHQIVLKHQRIDTPLTFIRRTGPCILLIYFTYAILTRIMINFIALNTILEMKEGLSRHSLEELVRIDLFDGPLRVVDGGVHGIWSH